MTIIPQKVSDVLMAFPGSVSHLMPECKTIPDQFKRGTTPQNKLFSKLFFEGGKLDWLKEKSGINRKDAIRQIKTIMGSFEPEHKHKDAAVAFMFSEWFEPFTCEDVKSKS